MINILVVDDSIEKLKKIKSALSEHLKGRSDIAVEYRQDIAGAKRLMEEKDIEIMILDLCLPVMFEDGPTKDGGLSLLQQIKKSVKYRYPDCVISLSQYKETVKKFKRETGHIHRAIHYDPANTEWTEELLETIDFVLPVIENNIVHRKYQYDIAVICALREELDYLKKMLKNMTRIQIAYDDTVYYTGSFLKEDGEIKIVAAEAEQMGMVSASALTTRMIHNFVPKYVVMTGIAAGIKNKVNLGDAIVAEFAWDYGAGKEIVEENGYGRHLNTFQPVNMDSSLLSKVRQLQQDQDFLDHIAEGFNGKVPETKFKIVIGPVATGAAVIANPDKVKDIINNQARNVVGVEMEIFGVYYAANWSVLPKPKFMAVKSVCDFADQKKDDDFHEYACYTSVKVFEKLAKEYMEY